MTETHGPSPRTNFLVLIGLLVLLGLMMLLWFLDPHVPSAKLSIALTLLLSVAKALLIMTFFMHLKWGSNRAVAFAIAGFLWLGIMFTLTFTDYLTRNSPADLNYKGEPRYLIEQRPVLPPGRVESRPT